MKRFIIRRAYWLRGEGADDSFLVRPSDRKMCCVGFFAEQCFGLSRGEMTGVGDLGLWRQLELVNCELTSLDVFNMNDKESTPEDVRETQLTDVFCLLGYEAVFE